MTRKHDQKGRSRDNKGEKFVKLDEYLLKSPAWSSLNAVAKVIYIELKRRYNGGNNGEIALSIRAAAHAVKCATNTAMHALGDLGEKGFIKIATRGSFHIKKRHATEYILTEHAYRDELPSKEFMRWKEKISVSK